MVELPTTQTENGVAGASQNFDLLARLRTRQGFHVACYLLWIRSSRLPAKYRCFPLRAF
jgi:hypothetical protein